MFVLSFIIMVLGITASIFNVLKNKLVFVFYLISNILIMITAVIRKDYPQLILFLVYSITSVIGYIKWSKDEKFTKNI